MQIETKDLKIGDTFIWAKGSEKYYMVIKKNEEKVIAINSNTLAHMQNLSHAPKSVYSVEVDWSQTFEDGMKIVYDEDSHLYERWSDVPDLSLALYISGNELILIHKENNDSWYEIDSHKDDNLRSHKDRFRDHYFPIQLSW